MADREHAREALEDAVHLALEAGMTDEEVRSEVAYAIDTHEED